MAQNGDERLVGWKAIGTFLGRDERTVRRWEAERGLPVYRVPGGGSASVWAMPDDLRAWMARDGAVAPSAETETPPESIVPARKRWPWAVAGFAAAAMVAVPLITTVRATNAPAAVAAPYGNDAKANDLYRAATYAMTTRSVNGLFDAAQKYSALANQYPKQPAAYVGIAETNLLLREFNSIPDETAYRRAAFAAQKALALDPKSPGALRSLAFVKYWSDGAKAEGLDLFKKAIAAAPEDAQTLHWYGTALLGEGRFRESLEMLDRAHALTPGSSAISADRAFVRFSMGDKAPALQALREINAIDPDFSGAHTYLARFYLVEKNDEGFLKSAAISARLKQDAERVKTIEAADKAYRTGGRAAMMASLIESAKAKFAQTGEKAISVAQLYAAAGNRDEVLNWLKRAESIREPEVGQLRAYVDFMPYQSDPAFKRFFGTR